MPRSRPLGRAIAIYPVVSLSNWLADRATYSSSVTSGSRNTVGSGGRTGWTDGATTARPRQWSLQEHGAPAEPDTPGLRGLSTDDSHHFGRLCGVDLEATGEKPLPDELVGRLVLDPLLANGTVYPEGTLPVTVSGGLKSKGHPVGPPGSHSM
jgi:hypothetical protein